MLGKYRKNGIERTVVACKDFEFENPKTVLKDFTSIKNSIILSDSQNCHGTELEGIINAIEEQQLIEKEELKSFFWQMFIMDAFLGNFDRHNGNWGLLINKETGESKIAPIFDCGSCLYPQLSDEDMKEYMEDSEKIEIDKRIYTFPNSALKINDKKINYFEYLSSTENKDCNQALLTIVPKINFDKINQIIDNEEEISNVRKKFYKVMLKERYNKILLPTYQKLINYTQA